MNRSTLLSVAAAAFLVASAAIAAPPAATTAAPRADRTTLDSNHDGVIDRAEAAQRPALASRFDQLDKNKDGRIDASERPKWQGRGHHGSRDGHGQKGERGGMHGLVRLDADGDGRISRAEVASQPKFAERFARIDRNRDGYLVRSELQAEGDKRRTQQQAEHRQRAEAKFAEADSNHDGKLSRAEVETTMPRLAKTFNFLDENRDGYLTRADLQPARHR